MNGYPHQTVSFHSIPHRAPATPEIRIVHDVQQRPCHGATRATDGLSVYTAEPAPNCVYSSNRGGVEAITKFYGEVGVKHFAIYLDSSTEAASALGAVGLPTTLLIDRDGNEIGRLVGPAEWDSSDMVAFVRDYLPKQSGLAAPPLRSADAGAGSGPEISGMKIANSFSATTGANP